jgi:PAS domain S-box-containing protein
MLHQSAVSGRILNLSTVVRYTVAIGAAAAAVLLRLALEPVWGFKLPFITLFPAIMLSAWVGGLGPGIVTTAITAVAAAYYWIAPARSWVIGDQTELLGLLVFAAIGAVISALNEAWRRGTAAIAESEERLNVTLTSIGDAVITTDEHGDVTRLNAVAEALTGWAAADAVGQPVHDVFAIINEDSRHPAANPVERVLRDGVTTGLANHTLLVAKDGRESPIDDSAAPIRTTDGRMAGVVMVFRDITERRRAERERAVLLEREQAARAEIERASKLKDEFLAVLSHELRTPLNAVIGYAHLLRSGALPPDRVSHALDAIQRNAQAQTRLVESLLDLSRVLAGKLELNLEELNLAAVVTGAVEALHPEAVGKNIVIDAAVLAIPLVGDASRLQQVFWNLLSNAVKFTARGGRIAIRSVREETQVRVLVSDNGDGIGAKFLPYIFDRFSRADGAKRRSPSGLGLGLALVREMVQAHGGTVVAESPGEGHGSTITVTLPLSAGAFPLASKAPVPSRVDAPESLSPIEILIVDDDGDVRDLLALLLESRGAIARTVASATEALEAISQRRPDLLLADLRMPDEDGYSLIRKVRARERERQERRLPAIAVTAYASSRDRDQAVAAGYDSHLAKPIEPGDLARAVAHVAKSVQRKKEAI